MQICALAFPKHKTFTGFSFLLNVAFLKHIYFKQGLGSFTDQLNSAQLFDLVLRAKKATWKRSFVFTTQAD